MSDIQKLIDGIVENKTFSLEAVEAIKSMRDELLSVKKENEALSDKVSVAEKSLKMQQDANSDLVEQVQTITAREKACGEREAQCHTAEIAQARNQARAEAYRTAMEIVFKPHTVRKSVIDNGPYSNYNTATNQTNMVSGTSMGNQTTISED